MKNILLVLFILITQLKSQAQCNFGEAFEITKAISLDQMYLDMENADSLDVQIQAIVVTTCKKAGCWMEVQSPDGKYSTKVFMKDHAFGVPLDGCAGKKTVINGLVFRYKLSVEYLRHLAEDAGKSKEEIDQITKPEEAIAIDAFGVWMAVECPKEQK